MSKPVFFVNNHVKGSNVDVNPVNVFDFLSDVREVFLNHNVDSIRGGSIGFIGDLNSANFGLKDSEFRVAKNTMRTEETLKNENEIEDLLYSADELAINRTIETLKNDLIDWGVWANGTHCAEINIDDVKRITRVVFELERRMKV